MSQNNNKQKETKTTTDLRYSEIKLRNTRKEALELVVKLVFGDNG
jgi:hypothetical protein